jgi:recombinational DNA repair protein (RecF pathway)
MSCSREKFIFFVPSYKRRRTRRKKEQQQQQKANNEYKILTHRHIYKQGGSNMTGTDCV